MQAELHQQFGFRSRDQHSGRNHQRQGPELADAGDVGQRFAGQQPVEACVKQGARSAGSTGTLVEGDELGAAHAGERRQQHLGIQPRDAPRARGGQQRRDAWGVCYIAGRAGRTGTGDIVGQFRTLRDPARRGFFRA